MQKPKRNPAKIITAAEMKPPQIRDIQGSNRKQAVLVYVSEGRETAIPCAEHVFSVARGRPSTDFHNGWDQRIDHDFAMYVNAAGVVESVDVYPRFEIQHGMTPVEELENPEKRGVSLRMLCRSDGSYWVKHRQHKVSIAEMRTLIGELDKLEEVVDNQVLGTKFVVRSTAARELVIVPSQSTDGYDDDGVTEEPMILPVGVSMR